MGAIFDSKLSFKEHVTDICKKSSFQLYRFQLYENILQKIHSFITSCLDYCNIIFYNQPKNLTKKIEKIRNVLMELHWFSVEQKIKFEVSVLT